MQRHEMIKEIKNILESNFEYQAKDIWVNDILRMCDRLEYINSYMIYLSCEDYMSRTCILNM